jgi:hypothetical protein
MAKVREKKLPPKAVGDEAGKQGGKLPPPAVDPAKPPPKPLAKPHQRVMERLNEKNRRRYDTSRRLVERLCDDHARAVVQAAERGEDPPPIDAELTAAICEYATTGRLT